MENSQIICVHYGSVSFFVEFEQYWVCCIYIWCYSMVVSFSNVSKITPFKNSNSPIKSANQISLQIILSNFSQSTQSQATAARCWRKVFLLLFKINFTFLNIYQMTTKLQELQNQKQQLKDEQKQIQNQQEELLNNQIYLSIKKLQQQVQFLNQHINIQYNDEQQQILNDIENQQIEESKLYDELEQKDKLLDDQIQEKSQELFDMTVYIKQEQERIVKEYKEKSLIEQERKKNAPKRIVYSSMASSYQDK
ncbi:Hypothetical_protein [Hexamita inflata]|uniref:Hypothetical_protein n=1 Tax=Hexamita inflata TaxID=28002 RepID=A0AA86TID6_9EUKA|nr:Hypothetical protein HINF_LOCUS1653 [Hexamita inflata]